MKYTFDRDVIKEILFPPKNNFEDQREIEDTKTKP
jgi:hypothetical protein